MHIHTYKYIYFGLWKNNHDDLYGHNWEAYMSLSFNIIYNIQGLYTNMSKRYLKKCIWLHASVHDEHNDVDAINVFVGCTPCGVMTPHGVIYISRST